jgi:serine/threonine-protein kinase RsbW
MKLFFLRVAANLQYLATIRCFIVEAATVLVAEPSVIPRLELAVDEAATNIIVHGYRGQSGRIEVEVGREGPDLIVCLRDDAPPFDPTTVPPPDLSRSPLEWGPGSLGLYLIRQIVDEIHYHRTTTGGNELTLIKKGILA